jgi:hypothetical protein
MRFFRKAPPPGSEVGRPVFTTDDQHIGNVKEVEGNALRIDSRMSKDYWLSRRDVESSNDDRLTVIFTSDELDDYKRKERPPDSVPQGVRLEDELERRRKVVDEDAARGEDTWRRGDDDG